MRRFPLFSFAAMVTFMAFGFPAIARAQSLPLVGNPTAISGGVFLPSSGDSKKSGGSSQLYVNLQYGFPINVPMTPTRTVVSLEGEFGTHGGHHSNIVPLTIGEYFGGSGKSPFAANNFFGGIGIGVYFENIGGFSSSAQIGGYGTIGYNVGSALFIAAKYQVVKAANGPIISAGVRF
jgi:hypothetical protein